MERRGGAEEFCRTRAEVFYLALSARSFVELSRSCLFLNLAQSPPSSRREFCGTLAEEKFGEERRARREFCGTLAEE